MAKKNKLPNFIIVGAAKAGTTSLNFYLDQHPDVFMCPIKEPHFFSTDIALDKFSAEYQIRRKRNNIDIEKYLSGPMTEKKWDIYIRSWDQYRRLFKNVSNEKAIGEISNSYLYSTAAAKNIYDTLPHAKIIIMLRNPIERAFSQYAMRFRDGHTGKSFREELEADIRKKQKGWHISDLYLELGLYTKQVQRYLRVFPKRQIKMFIFDDFRKQPAKVMQELLEFLGVDSSIKLDFSQKFNKSTKPRFVRLNHLITKYGLKKKAFRLIPKAYKEKVKALFFTDKGVPTLSDEDRDFLREYYRQEICDLSKLLKRDLNVWLK